MEGIRQRSFKINYKKIEEQSKGEEIEKENEEEIELIIKKN